MTKLADEDVFSSSFTFAPEDFTLSNKESAVVAPIGKSKFEVLEAKIESLRTSLPASKRPSEAGESAEINPKKEKKLKNKKEIKEEVKEEEVEEEKPVITVNQEYFDSGLETLGEQISTFADLNISRPLLKGLSALNFSIPTPIQRAAIPVALMGKDICGGAVTGSGKTAAFLIPIIERLLHLPKTLAAASRVLILLPTRELAVQCHEVCRSLCKFTNIKACLAAGGLPMRAQETELKSRPHIIIATPGRLIDHIRNSVSFSLDQIEILVLDEADRMLEDGFADELNEIIKYTPKQRQTILFSATMTDNVDELVRLSLKKPVRLFVDSNTAIAKKLKQEFVRIRQEREVDRLPLLLALCKRTCTERCIIFFPTKELAHKFRIILGLAGMKAAELHGALSQAERLDALDRFKERKVDFLTATDVAARGLDIQGVRFVLNYSMPLNYKLYLHRVGRTARADEEGCAITLVGEGADRKVLKEVIKNSAIPVKHRQIQQPVITEYTELIESMQTPLNTLLEEEKEARLLATTEKELKRVENLVDHKDQIGLRPKKTWFQSSNAKKESKNRDKKNRGNEMK